LTAQDGREVVATPAAAGAAGAWERGPAPHLINRLRPAPLESLGSLLERLRVANHDRERTWLGGLLRRHPERPEVLRRVRDFEVLEALTGLDRATLVGLTLHRFAPWYGVDRHLGRPLPGGVDDLSGPLWPDIGGDGNTRAAAAVCPACGGERAVIVLPWWLHQVTACPRHEVLLRERCAGCNTPLRLAAGRDGCGQCGAAIGAMGTRSIAGDADGGGAERAGVAGDGVRGGAIPPGRAGTGNGASGVADGDAGAAAGAVGRGAGGGGQGRGAAAARAGDRGGA